MSDLDYNFIKTGELENKPIYVEKTPDYYKLNKQEQRELLKTLGAKSIPKLEKDKVELIKQLKGGKE